MPMVACSPLPRATKPRLLSRMRVSAYAIGPLARRSVARRSRAGGSRPAITTGNNAHLHNSTRAGTGRRCPPPRKPRPVPSACDRIPPRNSGRSQPCRKRPRSRHLPRPVRARTRGAGDGTRKARDNSSLVSGVPGLSNRTVLPRSATRRSVWDPPWSRPDIAGRSRTPPGRGTARPLLATAGRPSQPAARCRTNPPGKAIRRARCMVGPPRVASNSGRLQVHPGRRAPPDRRKRAVGIPGPRCPVRGRSAAGSVRRTISRRRDRTAFRNARRVWRPRSDTDRRCTGSCPPRTPRRANSARQQMARVRREAVGTRPLGMGSSGSAGRTAARTPGSRILRPTSSA